MAEAAAGPSRTAEPPPAARPGEGIERAGGSFRDPAGFVFWRGGELRRRVHAGYAPHYERLRASGLYDELVAEGLLVPHREVEAGPGAWRELAPERVEFVSHPYEWSFAQLRDAALAALRIQERALARGMTLKDASAYNVQLHRGRAVWIDTLSFEIHEDGAPWAAYRQVCEHFLAPLALMAWRDVRLGQLLRVHVDGVPLDLARELLPARAWLDPQLFWHLRLHAGYQRRHAGDPDAARRRARPIPTRSLRLLVRGLLSAVERLRWEPRGTPWAEYYAGDSYSPDAGERKRRWVAAQLDRLRPARVWDLGANTGRFARLAAERGATAVAFDADPACVDRAWRGVRERGDARLLPLLLDLQNPSPAQGWAHRERASLLERRAADCVLALALVHHLAIGNQVPFPQIADFLAALAEHVLVEFVPASDPKARALLAGRESAFPGYTREAFESALARRFEIAEAAPLEGSLRTLYRLRRKG